jgi:protein associated with RNAse G/E
MDEIQIVKLNPRREETWRYTGRILIQENNHIVLEAFFNRDDMNLHGMPLCRGDRFVETYFTDRWYNQFEIFARQTGERRGWYCNITLPADFDGQTLSYVDLALDLLVFPDGRQVVLDEDEFAALDIPDDVRRGAWAALAELQEQLRQQVQPRQV